MPLNPLKWPLHSQILLALILGALTGISFLELGASESVIFPFQLGADIFLKLLKMVIIPLVVSSLFLGVTNASSIGELGKLGKKTALYYLFSSLLAIGIGIGFVNVMQPGVGADIPLTDNPENVSKSVTPPDSLWEILTRIIPKNPIASLVEFDMMGIIFFTIIFGIFTLQISRARQETLNKIATAVNDVMLQMVHWIISLAPIGVFCLITKLVAKTGFSSFMPLLSYLVTVSLALAFHIFIALPAVYYLVTKKNPYRFLNSMSSALLTAFSSASSAATLPLSMECAEKKAGLSSRVVSMVFPLGATVNMDGTALYEGVAVLFIAQVLGVDLTLFQQFTVFLTALLVSVGAAGIPHAGLVMMVVILEAVGLPLEATGIILSVDRFVDMARTAANVWSDSIGAAVVNHLSPTSSDQT